MPIITQPPPRTAKTGDGAAPIAVCDNCNASIVPCKCHPYCSAPFLGWVHIHSGSHLCDFPYIANLFERGLL